jgi:hypothetical protein
MRSRIRRRVVAFAVAGLSAVTLLATMAAVAVATVPGGLVDGQGTNIGRGGVFTVTPPTGWSTLSIVGGLAISAALMVLVAWLGIRSDNRARAQLSLAASGSAAGGAQTVRTEDRERRKAA